MPETWLTSRRLTETWLTSRRLTVSSQAKFNESKSLNEPIALALADLAKYERAVFLGSDVNPNVRSTLTHHPAAEGEEALDLTLPPGDM